MRVMVVAAALVCALASEAGAANWECTITNERHCWSTDSGHKWTCEAARPSLTKIFISGDKEVGGGRYYPLSKTVSIGTSSRIVELRDITKDSAAIVVTTVESAREVAISFSREPTDADIARRWESQETGVCSRTRAALTIDAWICHPLPVRYCNAEGECGMSQARVNIFMDGRTKKTGAGLPQREAGARLGNLRCWPYKGARCVDDEKKAGLMYRDQCWALNGG